MRERYSRPVITNASCPRRPVGRADQAHLIRRERRRRRVVEGRKRSPVIGSRRHSRAVRHRACDTSGWDVTTVSALPGNDRAGTARTVLISVVLMVVVAGLGVQTIVAHADEVGLDDSGGLGVRTTGAGDGLANEQVDIEVADLDWGLTVDFRKLTHDLGINPAQLVDDASEAAMLQALDAALDVVADETGFELDDRGELTRLHSELAAVQQAVDGYLSSNPADTDRSTLMVKDILDTMLPLMDPPAPCGSAGCGGAVHVVAIDDMLQAVDFAFDPKPADDRPVIGTEAAMIGLQCLIPAAVILVDRWRALKPDQQRDFLSLGVFTALNNAVSLLSRGVTTGIDAIGGSHAFAAETTRMAQAIVDNGAAGVPVGGIAAIDIRDDR